MGISKYDPTAKDRPAWNAGKQVGAKRALKVKQIWLIRFFLDREGRMRDRALFDLAIDSKLRGCDLVKMKIGSLVSGQAIRARSIMNIVGPRSATRRHVGFSYRLCSRPKADMMSPTRSTVSVKCLKRPMPIIFNFLVGWGEPMLEMKGGCLPG